MTHSWAGSRSSNRIQPHVNLAVSPDGNTILFRGMTRKGGDLMMIENFR